MSSEERKKILQMVQNGKISAEQAAILMRALNADADAAPPDIEVLETSTSAGDERGNTVEFEEVKARAQRFAMIPLWIGVFIAVVSAWAIYSVQQVAGINFWFFCLLVPLLFGVLLIVLGAGGPSSKWLYVNMDRRNAQDWPRNITLGFPLPLGLAAWFLRNFGQYIHGMQYTNMDEIIQTLDATGTSDAPLIINANNNEDGEHVQVYLG